MGPTFFQKFRCGGGGSGFCAKCIPTLIFFAWPIFLGPQRVGSFHEHRSLNRQNTFWERAYTGLVLVQKSCEYEPGDVVVYCDPTTRRNVVKRLLATEGNGVQVTLILVLKLTISISTTTTSNFIDFCRWSQAVGITQGSRAGTAGWTVDGAAHSIASAPAAAGANRAHLQRRHRGDLADLADAHHRPRTSTGVRTAMQISDGSDPPSPFNTLWNY